MTSGDIVWGSIYLGAVGMLSLAGVLWIGVAMDGETRFRRLMVPGLYLLMVLANCVTALLDARIVPSAGLGAGFDDLFVPGPPNPATKWVTRLAVVSALTVCVARILAAWFRAENRGEGGAGLFVGFFVYFLTNTVLSSAFGTHPEFMHELFYPPFLFGAVFASRTQDPELAIRFIKAGLFIFLASSCLVAVVAPELAIQRNYGSWIPGVTIRFWGLGAGPNSIGPLALLFLLLANYQPFARRWLHYLGIAIALAVFLLAQSKTAWVAAILAVAVLLILRSRLRWLEDPRPRDRASPAFALRVMSLPILAVLGVCAWLLLPELGVSVDRIFTPRASTEVASLTGRDVIWTVALNEWMRNPSFGYGVTMWDWGYRMHIGMMHATSAHNQFLQSLGTAGIAGLVGLLVYLGILSRYVINAWQATRGLSVALFVVVLSRCVTETPLSVEAFMTGDFLAHLLLFHLALVYGHRRGVPKRLATPPIAQGRVP